VRTSRLLDGPSVWPGGVGALVPGLLGCFLFPVIARRVRLRWFYFANGILGCLFTLSLVVLSHSCELVTPTSGRSTARNSKLLAADVIRGPKFEPPGAHESRSQRSERNTMRNQAVLMRLALEALTEVRMSDGDQRYGALRH